MGTNQPEGRGHARRSFGRLLDSEQTYTTKTVAKMQEGGGRSRISLSGNALARCQYPPPPPLALPIRFGGDHQ